MIPGGAFLFGSDADLFRDDSGPAERATPVRVPSIVDDCRAFGRVWASPLLLHFKSSIFHPPSSSPFPSDPPPGEDLRTATPKVLNQSARGLAALGPPWVKQKHALR